MITLFFNDFLGFIIKTKKMILLYLLVIISYLLLNLRLFDQIDTDMLHRLLGLNIDLEYLAWDSMLIYLFSCSIYIFIFFDLFFKDISNAMGNIFLRITPLKWFIYKIALITFITIIIYLFLYTIVYIIIFPNIIISVIVTLLLKNIIYILILQMVFCFLYLLSKSNTTLCFLLSCFSSYIIISKIKILDTNLILGTIVFILLLVISKSIYVKIYPKTFEN